ncbi:MAG TPA: primosomal protein N', partial [Candidatus Limnocylindrales bacterium]|nr:primosomal protein N' [Candidatus Limnocylindrales bacterium]
MAQQPQRLVEVAVDVAGLPGGRLYTYHVPPRLADVVAGEAVLVDYGRRQALGIVLGDAAEPPPGVKTRPLLERVRSDGALLQPLGVMLARAMTEGYLAPAALAVRAMLPPGLLERLELMARLPRPVPAAKREAGVDMQAGGGLATTDPELRAALERIHAAGPAGLPVRSLRPPRDRAALLRRLRGLAAAGELELEWLLLPAGARPRLVRLARLSEAGLATARKLAGGGEAGGPRLGPRQRALLAELLDSAKGAPAARLAERHGGSAVSGLARRGLLELELLAEERRPLAGRTPVARPARPAGSALSAEQQHIVGRVRPGIAERRHERFLLEGAIASGKTAVYAELIAAALQAGRSALVLVPETPLAAPLLDRLRAELGITPALVHSGLSEGERADEWRRIRAALAPVVIGTRIGVLAPLADPGLIVVDEEHDPAYKSDRTPRYQARDLALELGRLAGCPVVLGSATPDVVSVGRARAGELVPLRLAARLGGVDPSVEVVDLRAELEAGNRSLLSRSLEEALATLDTHAGERAILVLNRRGSASIVLCRDCGHVQSCPDCQRPLVFHAAGLSLRCHHCGASAPIARRCPACDSSRIRYL